MFFVSADAYASSAYVVSFVMAVWRAPSRSKMSPSFSSFSIMCFEMFHSANFLEISPIFEMGVRNMPVVIVGSYESKMRSFSSGRYFLWVSSNGMSFVL